jgi:hypothetical protein
LGKIDVVSEQIFSNNDQIVLKSDKDLYFLRFDPTKGEESLEVLFQISEEIKEGRFISNLFFYMNSTGRIKVVIGQKGYCIA